MWNGLQISFCLFSSRTCIKEKNKRGVIRNWTIKKKSVTWIIPLLVLWIRRFIYCTVYHCFLKMSNKIPKIANRFLMSKMQWIFHVLIIMCNILMTRYLGRRDVLSFRQKIALCHIMNNSAHNFSFSEMVFGRIHNKLEHNIMGNRKIERAQNH